MLWKLFIEFVFIFIIYHLSFIICRLSFIIIYYYLLFIIFLFFLSFILFYFPLSLSLQSNPIFEQGVKLQSKSVQVNDLVRSVSGVPKKGVQSGVSCSFQITFLDEGTRHRSLFLHNFIILIFIIMIYFYHIFFEIFYLLSNFLFQFHFFISFFLLCLLLISSFSLFGEIKCDTSEPNRENKRTKR